MLAEYHLAPDYVNHHFTEELLELMFRKRARRIRRETDAIKNKRGDGDFKRVPEQDLFELAGTMPKRVVKKKG